ncbi:MAG: hypothetical protein R2873_26630 [Caldilineaceae bacterium]
MAGTSVGAEAKLDDGQAEVAHIAEDSDDHIRADHFGRAPQRLANHKAQQRHRHMHRDDERDHAHRKVHFHTRIAHDVVHKGRHQHKIGQTGQCAAIQPKSIAHKIADHHQRKDRHHIVKEDFKQQPEHIASIQMKQRIRSEAV